MARLSDRARCEGIRRFTALVAACNPAMAGLLRNAGACVCREPGTLRYEIMLGPAGWAQPGADAAGLVLSSGGRMKAAAGQGA